jgi:predicted nucleic acid-binding Zn ribbon protein
MSPWRPLPGEEGATDPRPVGDSLPHLARQLGAPAPEVLTTVFGHWDEIVGAAIAAHAWPLSLSRGVLRVGVDQPGWATQLRFLGPDLVKRLAAAAHDDVIETIEVKVVPDGRK